MKAVILSGSLLVGAMLMISEGEDLLRSLLRDIPESELASNPSAEGAAEVRRVVGERSLRIAESHGDLAGCRAACVSGAQALNEICERHVLPTAPRSRAVCYERVDDDRALCLQVCRG